MLTLGIHEVTSLVFVLVVADLMKLQKLSENK